MDASGLVLAVYVVVIGSVAVGIAVKIASDAGGRNAWSEVIRNPEKTNTKLEDDRG